MNKLLVHTIALVTLFSMPASAALAARLFPPAVSRNSRRIEKSGPVYRTAEPESGRYCSAK